MHILFTNNSLDTLEGSELYVYDLACEFQRRGHEVHCFSMRLGKVAAHLEQAGIQVTNDLTQIDRIDLIHAHHPLETRVAVAFFPFAPVVFVSHGIRAELERPRADHHCITRYVAISEEVQNFLIDHDCIPADKVDMIHNFADMRRFTAQQPIARQPRRVLALSNRHSSTVEAQIIQAACEIANLELRAIGHDTRSVWDVERHIEWADVVIAVGRSAVQAMAMERATVVYKYTGGDGLVRPSTLDMLARTNFGGRTHCHQYTPEQLAAEITGYQVAEVQEVCRRVRNEFSLSRAADQLLAVYTRAESDFKESWPSLPGHPRLEGVLRDVGSHLATFKEADLWRFAADWGQVRQTELLAQLQERNAHIAELQSVLYRIHYGWPGRYYRFLRFLATLGRK